MDPANILAKAVVAGGGKAGADGRHKGGHKAETTATTVAIGEDSYGRLAHRSRRQRRRTLTTDDDDRR